MRKITRASGQSRVCSIISRCFTPLCSGIRNTVQ